jgi:hypothetical protein
LPLLRTGALACFALHFHQQLGTAIRETGSVREIEGRPMRLGAKCDGYYEAQLEWLREYVVPESLTDHVFVDVDGAEHDACSAARK